MFAISPTDIDWFYFNKMRNQTNSINFWTPTPWNIKRLNHGDRLYFMLKSPIRKIGGFGIFNNYENLSIPDAWEKFGYGNGVESKPRLIKRLNKYLSKNTSLNAGLESHQIGCISLNNCEFWEDIQFIDIEQTIHEFKKNIVKIKFFNEYDSIQSHHNSLVMDSSKYEIVGSGEKHKKAYQQNVRIGQSEFRAKLINAYHGQCCISKETCEELLEAAHIQPYINKKSNHVQNGLLLRIDLHKLFDSGLLKIDQNYLVHISSQLQSGNYRTYDKKRILLPKNPNNWPSKMAIFERNKNYRK